MIQAIIVDDEQHCIDRLQGLLTSNHADQIAVKATFSSTESGLDGIRRLHPDLVFLDVMLTDGSGFELLQQLDHHNFELVFTTAYERFALKAIKCSALDYLLKPIDADDLGLAVEKCLKKISENQLSSKLEVLMHNLDDLKGSSKRIVLPTLNGYTFVNIKDIIRCHAEANYTTIYLANNQSLLISRTLKEFEELLTDYNFFRVHNSHLINISYIRSYNKGKGGYVTLLDNSEIEVSTRKKADFLQLLTKL